MNKKQFESELITLGANEDIIASITAKATNEGLRQEFLDGFNSSGESFADYANDYIEIEKSKGNPKKELRVPGTAIGFTNKPFKILNIIPSFAYHKDDDGKTIKPKEQFDWTIAFREELELAYDLSRSHFSINARDLDTTGFKVVQLTLGFAMLLDRNLSPSGILDPSDLVGTVILATGDDAVAGDKLPKGMVGRAGNTTYQNDGLYVTDVVIDMSMDLAEQYKTTPIDLVKRIRKTKKRMAKLVATSELVTI